MRKYRFIEEKFFRILMFAATLFIAIALVLIIVSILVKGLPALTWEILSQTPKGGFFLGREGGILNAIIGSIYLSIGATLLALAFSLPLALFMNVYLTRHREFVNVIRYFLDILWGVPSIVYGAFGFTIMILFGMSASLLAGIITVTLLIIPIMTRAMDEVFKMAPTGLLEASLSLGATRSETAYSVFLKQCFPGVITAILLSFGRAIGDIAAVLFTTGFTDHIPTSLFHPTATLPLSIFFQLSSPIPEVQDRAYVSALVLTSFILIISMLTRLSSRRSQKNKVNF